MRNIKLTFSLLLIFKIPVLTNSLFGQNINFPDTSIAKKFGIRQIKIYNYNVSNSDSNNLSNRQLVSKYIFNSKGQLVKENQINVDYTYYYFDSLWMIQEKWKILTNRWVEGIPYSCTCYYKDTISNSTIIKEFEGKCKERYKSKGPIQISRIYRDGIGRDTLSIVEFNKWYYSYNDTGYTQNKYVHKDLDLIEWKQISRYGNYKKENIRHIKINSINQVIEIYSPRETSTCPRFRFHYENEILTRKTHYNCLDKISDIDIYEYIYYKRKKKAL